MEDQKQLLVCPECGEQIVIAEAELELDVGVICEACYAPLQVVELDPIVLRVLDIDLDDLDDEDVDDDDDDDDLDSADY